ncbi:class I SAM-dependent methyltransferase [Nodularia sp. NIES-3585]|uniref:class I SAM-dependent methyltransferase n=1 Tax=Nodularia sp. NIES-3585 TaxID=1973477 RepID=UPI000B5C7795|nr:class I SAM-dependent methyltransferase [Nodularia sp. NIES-3585]GAX36704.1 putative methyltransferase [Nodularia sp. NIES-3585]
MKDSKFQTWEEAVSWLISQPEKQELVLACYYDKSLKSAAERYWKSEEWQAIQKFLPQHHGTALDIGAGNGIASYALAKDGWQVKALEPDSSDLVGVGAIRKLSEESQLAIEVTQEFGEKLPFSNQTFDLVFARQVLHHAQDLQRLCNEIYRVLKPGGIFIAVREHVISSPSDLPKFLNAHPLHNLYGGENAYLLKQYLGAIKFAELRINQVIAPFESVINYAPLTEQSLKTKLKKKFHAVPIGAIIYKLFSSKNTFNILLKLLSTIDNRPGRLFSFVCYKPEDKT